MTHVLAVDVGGTSIKAALFAAPPAPGEPLEPVTEVRRPTPRAGSEDIAGAVAGAVAETTQAVLARAASMGVRAEPTRAGVAVPGIVDARAGVGTFSGNLGWRDAPVAELLGRALGLPVALVHDVTAAGVAEHRLGAG